MLQSLVNSASRLFDDLHRSLFRRRSMPMLDGELPVAAATTTRPVNLSRLERVVLTDEVSRTIFEEYARHRQTERGDEETGWVLLGVREPTEAIVLATLPAGAERSASATHVRFNSNAQAIASRIVRHWDRRLTILGILHTHPGSLRQPSRGDYHGDSQWVGQLRGREGVFGIGTADGDPLPGPPVAHQPQKHLQCLGELCLSWYALGEGDPSYHRLPVDLTLGPDLARCLHALWPALENHATALERLCRQQTGIAFEMTATERAPALVVKLPLIQRDQLRVVLSTSDVKYYLCRDEDLIEVSPNEPRLDRSVYLILAELAGQS